MKATEVRVDSEFEADGLFGVTLWVDCTPPGYVSICRDELEKPDSIYVEAQDQKYGFATDQILLQWRNSTLVIQHPEGAPWRFHWSVDDVVEIDIPESDVQEVKRVLIRIAELGRKFEM